jgi:hypothetical protein
MKKYEVNCVMPVFMTITVEADNEEDAIDKASDDMYLNGYCGNGARYGRLVGHSRENVCIEAGECVIEDEFFKIEVEEIDE